MQRPRRDARTTPSWQLYVASAAQRVTVWYMGAHRVVGRHRCSGMVVLPIGCGCVDDDDRARALRRPEYTIVSTEPAHVRHPRSSDRDSVALALRRLSEGTRRKQKVDERRSKALPSTFYSLLRYSLGRQGPTDGVRFELTIPGSPVCRFSRPVPSTTRPPVRSCQPER
jgi:hypothetical protein